MSAFVLKDPDAIFTVEALQVMFTQGGAVMLLFVPKIHAVREGIVLSPEPDGINHIIKRAGTSKFSMES
jgi:hypothetical protein